MSEVLTHPVPKAVRGENGKFAPGTAPGPGRPRRAIEIDYARVVADAVSLEAWKAIVDKAVADAKAGDSKAREFIASRLIGADPLPLTALAIRELAGIDAAEEISAAAALRGSEAARFFEALGHAGQDPLDFAIVRRQELAEEARDQEFEREEILRRADERERRAARKAVQNANG